MQQKRRGFGKIHTKNIFWAKYKGEKRHLGQNAIEEKRKGFGKIHTRLLKHKGAYNVHGTFN